MRQFGTMCITLRPYLSEIYFSFFSNPLLLYHAFGNFFWALISFLHSLRLIVTAGGQAGVGFYCTGTVGSQYKGIIACCFSFFEYFCQSSYCKEIINLNGLRCTRIVGYSLIILYLCDSISDRQSDSFDDCTYLLGQFSTGEHLIN